MKINKFTAGLIGLIFGILANSINVETPKPFRFNNPIPLNTLVRDQEEIIEKRPLMVDKEYNLRLFGLKIPIVAYRTVQDPSHFKVYSGRLDREGNIHTSKEVYELQFTHDSNWYVQK